MSVPDEPRFARPTVIYHIAESERWTASGASYAPDTFEREGFVHCSAWRQLAAVTTALFRERRDLVVLRIDTLALASKVVWEDCYDSGDEFPHVYGPIARQAVTGTFDLGWSAASRPVFIAREETVSRDSADTQPGGNSEPEVGELSIAEIVTVTEASRARFCGTGS